MKAINKELIEQQKKHIEITTVLIRDAIRQSEKTKGFNVNEAKEGLKTQVKHSFIQKECNNPESLALNWVNIMLDNSIPISEVASKLFNLKI